MRWTIVGAACIALAACGDDGLPRVARSQPPPLALVGSPLVFTSHGSGVEVWVRLDRPLRDNEGALGEYRGFEATIAIPGTTEDIPGLYRDDLHPTCYGQFLDGDLADGASVSVALVLSDDQRLTATAHAQLAEGVDTQQQALLRLGCPTDGGATRRCRGTVGERTGMGISVRSATHASCRAARIVMRSVNRWASSTRCYRTLCVSKHRINRGYRCSVDLVGEAAWQITCVRGRRIVRGFTAE